MLQQLDTAIGFSVVMLLLSLLITVGVQAVAAVLDLRGRNLVWGVMKVLHQVDPQFQKAVEKDWNEAKSTVGKKIAEAVAAHPSIKHSWLGRATAIRQDELMKILQDLAKRPPADLEASALKTLQDWATKTVPNPDALAAANAILAKVETLIPAHAADVKRAIDQVVGAGTRLEEGVSQWFDSVMDRSSDKFAQLTRIITVVFAVLMAFGLGINAIDIFKQISGSSEIQAKLAGIADQTLKQADAIKFDGNRGKAALLVLKANHPDDASITSVIDQASGKDDKGNDKTPLSTCQDAEHWWTAQQGADKLLTELSKICQQQIADALKEADHSYNSLRASLDGTGLHILPEKFPSTPSTSNIRNFYRDQYKGQQVLGMLATTLLLSLGAPFWYNALRQLGSLKPVVAQKIDQSKSDGNESTENTQSS